MLRDVFLAKREYRHVTGEMRLHRFLRLECSSLDHLNVRSTRYSLAKVLWRICVLFDGRKVSQVAAELNPFDRRLYKLLTTISPFSCLACNIL